MERFIPKYTADGLRAVSEAIAIDKNQFDMGDYARKTVCGTPMCIIGHFNVLRGLMPTGFNQSGIVRAFGGLLPLEQFYMECGLSKERLPKYAVPDDDRRMWLFLVRLWPTHLREMHRNKPVLAAQLAIETYLDQYEIRESNESTPEQIADAIITDALVSR